MFNKNFIEDCLNVEAFITDLDAYINYWHEHDTGNTLQEFLGLTDYEYAQWVISDDGIFRDIIRCREDGLEFSTYQSMTPENRIAARSSDIEAVEKLKNSENNE